MEKEKGSAIYFTFIVLSIMLATALGISVLLIGQIKLMTGIENSVVAFYATDSGIENILYQKKIEAGISNCSGEIPPSYCSIDLNNGASAQATFTPSGANCLYSDGCIKSVGSYSTGSGNDAQRAIEINLGSIFICGDPITFIYKGNLVTYGTVLSNGKCWMDRNLGAWQVATAYNDSDAYGDLFQWGRLDDQHQTRTSGTTTNLSGSDVPGHANFIRGMGSPYDWRSPQNNNLWQGVSGNNNPCPVGWRLPTDAELDAERASWSSQNYNGAFASPLKLTAGGYRYYDSASLYGMGSYGFYWSSTVYGSFARDLYFVSGDAGMSNSDRIIGFSVRCLKD